MGAGALSERCNFDCGHVHRRRVEREGVDHGKQARLQLEQLDRELCTLARADGRLRLELGQLLEVMAERAWHFSLGFSSIAAYALERCQRRARWVEGARCLARRLKALPALSGALCEGSISWSMAEVVARVARAEDELVWLDAARGHTVRELRERVRAGGAQGCELAEPVEVEEMCTLTCTVDREDAWLFEATRALLAQLGTCGSNEQVEALLAEGQEALLGALPLGAIDLDGMERKDTAQQRWREQLQRWQREAEQRCEARIGAREAVSPAWQVRPLEAASSLGALEIDARVTELARRFARQELELSRRILALHRADGWRRLGYASESQYARERLGLSRSSLLARRALAARLEVLPQVAQALGSAQLGVEAALQLVRIATPQTERVWLERAARRTLKHLREEVAAALSAVRISGEADCPPPAEVELDAYAELERAVASGGAARGGFGARSWLPEESQGAWRTLLTSLAEWLEGGFQMSAARHPGRAPASAGRVEIRLRISRGMYTWWRELEAQARRWLRAGVSWLKYLCLSFWRAWRHVLGVDVAYGGVYLRDCFRCRSPVCGRRDVTPHHLRFRSAGGGDELENVASVCSWCHLFGIHGGRIRAHGTAQLIHWELGPREQPCLVVHGRERCAA